MRYCVSSGLISTVWIWVAGSMEYPGRVLTSFTTTVPVTDTRISPFWSVWKMPLEDRWPLSASTYRPSGWVSSNCTPARGFWVTESSLRMTRVPALSFQNTSSGACLPDLIVMLLGSPLSTKPSTVATSWALTTVPGSRLGITISPLESV